MTDIRHIKNVIFDVDGTLLDSRRDIAAAQLWTLHQFGVDSFRPEDIYPHIGKPLAETFEILLPPELHVLIPEATLAYRDYYRAHAFDTTSLFPGVKETVDSLKQLGMNLATATTKSTETTAKVLDHFGIAHHFIHVQGTDNTPFKPDPYIINTILQKQDWRKEESLMVGDTDRDINVGKNAGIMTCGVTYGSFTRDQMATLRPDWMIDHIAELIAIAQEHG